MKKTKFMITILAILSIAAGGLAFKVQKHNHNPSNTFYACTTTNLGTGQTYGCLLTTQLSYGPTDIPGTVIPFVRMTTITNCDPEKKMGCTALVTPCL